MKELNYAVDNINLIKKLEIQLAQELIDLSQCINKSFKGKFVFNVECVDSFENSFLVKHVPDFQPLLKKVIETNDSFKILIEDEVGGNKSFSHDKQDNTDSCKIGVYLYKDVPYTGEVPDSSVKKDLLERASIINIHVAITGDEQFFNYESNNNRPSTRYCGGFSELGFVLADIDLLSQFLIGKNYNNDLIEEFTTSELANEIFDNGLMILEWGNTPWVYYILPSQNMDALSHFVGNKTSYNGKYYLKKEINHLSVIPGHALRDWNKASGVNWPKILIEGIGESVSLDLYVRYALSQSDSNYPIPTFVITRQENVPVTEPLLESYLNT